jgi:hypothetical protein
MRGGRGVGDDCHEMLGAEELLSSVDLVSLAGWSVNL